ncbi:LuxR C-terminal-related transcriptional regulator [Serratia sp. L9]|uniref:response regulator transcription factor n=1 Tax=Serratia sp. L9 TaxID=3423946 RepID=UPI003D664325
MSFVRPRLVGIFYSPPYYPGYGQLFAAISQLLQKHIPSNRCGDPEQGSPEDFFNQIEYVISGEKITPSSTSRLSSREICLLRALTRGETVRDIAHRLQLSPKTVYAMRHNMLGKMGLNKMSDIYMPMVNGAK